jgi:hypothetical protein
MRILLTLTPLVFLMACGGGSNPDLISIKPGPGSFTGTAGANWTDRKLRQNELGAVCGVGGNVASIKIDRDEQATASISGTCA